MRFLGLLTACVLVIAAGIGIGATPFVNEYLHWNLWFVIPVSGLLLGAGFGWVQFQIARAFGLHVGGAVASALALGGPVFRDWRDRGRNRAVRRGCHGSGSCGPARLGAGQKNLPLTAPEPVVRDG